MVKDAVIGLGDFRFRVFRELLRATGLRRLRGYDRFFYCSPAAKAAELSRAAGPKRF